MTTITLASSSPYRRDLLARLGLDFDCLDPAIDEASRPGETPPELVLRLAERKARAVAERHRRGLIIGSDQVACLDRQVLTKPGNFDNARRQLLKCSGRSIIFYTGLALLNSDTNRCQLAVETTEVAFRALAREQIERYLNREQPFDCAGSFKMEGLGISLFTKIIGEDPNALVGLPLIRLVEFLQREGIAIP